MSDHCDGDYLIMRAKLGDASILTHPKLTSIRTVGDGRTPLHWLAIECRDRDVDKIIKHPECLTVRNRYGSTPAHNIADMGKMYEHQIKKLFPWYTLKYGEEINYHLITKLLNMPNSAKFIMGKE